MPPRASNPRGGLVPNLDKVPSVTAIAAARRSLVEQAKADRGLRGEHHSLCSALPPPQPVTVVAYESPATTTTSTSLALQVAVITSRFSG